MKQHSADDGLHSEDRDAILFYKKEGLCMRHRKRGIFAVIAVLGAAALLMVLNSRQPEQTAHIKDLFAMDTYFSLKAYGPAAEAGLEACALRVRELEGLLSVTEEGSDIRRVNERHAGEAVSVERDTLLLLEEAVALGEETGGALDITLYPVLRAWGFTAEEYRIPREQELSELLQRVDYRKLALDDTASTVLLPEGMELDLGAVAKGYTGDCLTELLRERGVLSAMLDLGGNIQVLGTKPDGSPWRIAVKNPYDTGRAIGVLEVADKAVITSGSYERYFVGEDGRRYWHILDPKDGRPADGGLVSVTVVGESGVRCDGLSTALFVMGRERAVEFWQQSGTGEFEMILLTEEGKVYITEGLDTCFECSEGWSAERICRGQ